MLTTHKALMIPQTTFIYIAMHSQLPLSETMPLFAPVYQPTSYALFSELKQRMREGVFDQSTNSLAEKILINQPSNYNAWYCKKMYILSQPPTLDIEHQVNFANSCLGDKAKSFQVWQQKRFLLEYHKAPQREIEVSGEVIQQIDHKNYHAWSFRTWVVEQYGLWKEELSFAEEMIEDDCFNNSAWTYRFFLIRKEAEGKNWQERQVIAAREVEYALNKIEQEKSNRASWNYLRGLFPSIQLRDFSSKNTQREALIDTYERFSNVQTACQKWWHQIKNKSSKGDKEEELKTLVIQREIMSTLVHIYSQKEENKHFAVSLCDQLAEKEKQRAFYWKWVQSHL